MSERYSLPAFCADIYEVTVDEGSQKTRGSAQSAGDDVSRVAAELRRLLERHPATFIGALGADDMLPVPVPVALSVPPERTVPPDIMMGAVVADDRMVVAELWARARAEGVAVGRIRVRWRPEIPGDLYLFDLKHSLGVSVAAFVDDVGGIQPSPQEPATPVRRQTARVSKDAASVVRAVDPGFSELLGWRPEEVVGRRMVDLIHPDDRETGMTHWVEMLQTGGSSRPVRLRHRRRDGSWVWIEVSNYNRLSDPKHADVVAEMVDVSEEMAAHEALRAREQLLAQITETLPVGLFHADLHGRLLFTNPRLDDITGDGGGTTLAEQMEKVVVDDRARLQRAVISASHGAEIDVQLSIEPRPDDLRHCRMSLRPLVDGAGTVTGLTGCLEDITEMVRSRRELEAKAAKDPLTGCLNREATLTLLEKLLRDRELPGAVPSEGTAVIFVDIDGLKPLNDRFGHAAGDELLMTVASRVRDAIRAGDIVGRFGGDEFVIVCAGVPAPAEALTIARSLHGRAFRPVDLPSAGPVDVGASMGVAWTDRTDVGASRMIEAADAAMYRAKRSANPAPVLSDPVLP